MVSRSPGVSDMVIKVKFHVRCAVLSPSDVICFPAFDHKLPERLKVISQLAADLLPFARRGRKNPNSGETQIHPSLPADVQPRSHRHRLDLCQARIQEDLSSAAPLP